MNTKLLGQQSHMLVSELQFLIFHNEMLTIETAVSSANLRNKRFHEPWEESSSPCFARTTIHLNLLGQKRKIRTAVPYKLMAQDKDAVLCKRIAQDKDSVQINTTRQGPQSFANE